MDRNPENSLSGAAKPAEHAVFSIATYSICFAALVFLTLSSFGLSGTRLGILATVVAMAIALAKTTLVAVYFMHLAKEPASHRLAAVAGAIFVVILVVFAVLDVLMLWRW